MKKNLFRFAIVLNLVAVVSFAAKVNEPAPDFSAKGIDGKDYKLSALNGKYVVLEWHNKNCPFVMKHYETGNMQKLQSEWTKRGVVWLTVVSSAPGKQGSVTAQEEEVYLKKKNSTPTSVILDADGKIAGAYGAKTTPHMFVINPKGFLVYNGAIDDKNSTDAEDVPKAHNYISTALTESLAGKPVSVASTAPYGCSVKHK